MVKIPVTVVELLAVTVTRSCAVPKPPHDSRNAACSGSVSARDPDSKARLSASGLRVVEVDAKVLQDRFGIEAAPVLIVLDPQDRARYLGERRPIGCPR